MGEEKLKKVSPTRRHFLVSSIVAVGGVILSGLLFLRDSFLFLFPNRKKQEFTRYLVAKVNEIPAGKAKEITIADKPVFIIRLAEDFKVFSGICTHLGCIIKWKEKEKQFYCPCHRAFFDKDGSVLAGPAIRPLDEFQVEVENSLIFIWIKKRKGGILS